MRRILIPIAIFLFFAVLSGVAQNAQAAFAPMACRGPLNPPNTFQASIAVYGSNPAPEVNQFYCSTIGDTLYNGNSVKYECAEGPDPNDPNNLKCTLCTSWSGSTCYSYNPLDYYICTYLGSGVTKNATAYQAILYDNCTHFSPDSTAPAAINNLAVSSCSSSTCMLTWTAPGDDGNTGTAASYEVRYSTSPINSSNWSFATQASSAPAPGIAGSSQNMTVFGLSPTATYYFAIKTADEVLNWSGLSNVPYGTTSAPPDNTPPTVPDGFSAVAGGATQINLSWNASTDPIVQGESTTGVGGYRLERCQGAGCMTFSFVANITSGTTYVDTGLTPETTYTYRVRAYDNASPVNNSAWSATASATTPPAPDTTPPIFNKTSPPDLLPIGTTSTVLGGFTNESAICRYSDIAGQNFDSMTPMEPSVPATSFTVSVFGLVNGGSYTYYVKCRDTAPVPNTSGDFPVAFAVDSPAPDLTPPVIISSQPANGTVFPSDTTIVILRVDTNEPAYCRYDTRDISYDLMSVLMSRDTNRTAHTAGVLVSDGTSYTFYVRCEDDPAGNKNTSSYPIFFSVANPPNILPTAVVNAGPLSGDAPLNITADGSGSSDPDGNIVQYIWSWGDGSPNTFGVSSAAHGYSSAGTYQLSLTVVDNQGGSNTKSVAVVVNALPDEPPPPDNVCAEACDDDADCFGLNIVCAPNGICMRDAGFCEPGTLTCSNGTVCPENGICPAPLIFDAYFSLPDDSNSQLSLASFSSRASSLIMSVKTDVNATCQYSADPNAEYGNAALMKNFTVTGSTAHSVTLTVPKTNAVAQTPQQYNYYIRCRDAQAGGTNMTGYQTQFTVGGPSVVSGPGDYICSINSNFIKRGIPYLLDVCAPGIQNTKIIVECIPSSCSAPAPACGQTTYGVDNCGSQCSKVGSACMCIPSSCSAPAPACGQTTYGVDNCGSQCSKVGSACMCIPSSCSAPAPACGQTTYGVDNCGSQCSKVGSACSSDLYGGKSFAQCTGLADNNGTGEVISDGTNYFCRFDLASCPGGWTKYNDWNTTTVNICGNLNIGECGTAWHDWADYNWSGGTVNSDNVRVEYCLYDGLRYCYANVTQIGCY